MKKWLLALGFALILAGAGIFAWTAIPAPEMVKTLTIGGPQQASDQTPGVWWEYRTVTIHYPATLRLGDVSHLRLEVAPAGVVAGAETPFAQYAVFAEAYPEIAALTTAPGGTLSQAWAEGEALEFTWQVRGDLSGTFEGRLWFLLRLVPRDGSQESYYPLLAVPLEVEVVSLLGLDITALRWIGLLLALAGLGLLFWRGRILAADERG